jgi:diguanylate cyclase (GGDEF)-like protein
LQRGDAMNVMQRLVSRSHVLMLSVTVACLVGIITTLSNWLAQDAGLAERSLMFDLIRAFVLGGTVTYYLGLKVVQVNQLSQKLDRMATYDYLTGALTRAGFFGKMAAQPKVQGAFLVFDMNGFKAINDTLGHALGDEALIKVAQAARSQLRPQDDLCRLGGDEFLAFFPGMDHFHLYDRARAIAMEIMGQSVALGTQSFQLSASFGLSMLAQDEDIDAAIALADADLYRAKSIHYRRQRGTAMRSRPRLRQAN